MKDDPGPSTAPLSTEAPGQAEARKGDHIELAFQSRTESGELDRRFSYEPLLAAHPAEESLPEFTFLGKILRTPLWVSSMTGGAKHAFQINTALARACRVHGMGMGLGSCRALLYSDEHLADFNVRDLMGDELPLFANLGIAQLEELQDKQAIYLVEDLLRRLNADGLIVHVNPLQEWFQPEGDRFRRAPLTTLHHLLDQATYPVIVKEVGQGMGYESLRHLLHLPLAAVDFGAAGGTNFALLENLRRSDQRREHWAPLVRVGHDATQMVTMVNRILREAGGVLPCKQIIVSGGVRDFLDGYYLTGLCDLPAMYGQASALLRHALQGDEALDTWIRDQLRGLELARAFLRINTL